MATKNSESARKSRVLRSAAAFCSDWLRERGGFEPPRPLGSAVLDLVLALVAPMARWSYPVSVEGEEFGLIGCALCVLS